MGLASYARVIATDLSSVREALLNARYNDEVCASIERGAVLAGQIDLEAAMDATADGTARCTIARLMMLGRDVSRAEAEAAFGEAGLRVLAEIGVVTPAGDNIRAEVSILPIEDHFTVRDFSPLLGDRPMTDDHVLGVGPSTRILADLTVRPPVSDALDLGAGQGYQTVLAAEHAARVVGTDINPRALSCAAIAAGLNARGNIELREGSLFEPVGDERFDLVVSNPPFLIVPPSDLVAVTSRFEGDQLVERIAREAPSHLRDGGYLCMMCSWHHRTKEDWASRPRSWVEGAGCDAWIMKFEMLTPAECTMKFRREFQGTSLTRVQRDEWLAYYRRLGADLVTIGGIILRKRDGRNWTRCDELSPDYRRPWAGGVIETIFENEAILSTLAPGAILDARTTLAPTVEVEQKWQAAEDGGLNVVSATIRHLTSLQLPLSAHATVLRLMTLLDGRTTLREALRTVAESMNLGVEQVLKDSVPGLERLARLGYLRLRGAYQ